MSGFCINCYHIQSAFWNLIFYKYSSCTIYKGVSRLFKGFQDFSRFFKVVQECSRFLKVFQGVSSFFQVFFKFFQVFFNVFQCFSMFEGDSADMWAGKFPLMLMGGRKSGKDSLIIDVSRSVHFQNKKERKKCHACKCP